MGCCECPYQGKGLSEEKKIKKKTAFKRSLESSLLESRKRSYEVRQICLPPATRGVQRGMALFIENWCLYWTFSVFELCDGQRSASQLCETTYRFPSSRSFNWYYKKTARIFNTLREFPFKFLQYPKDIQLQKKSPTLTPLHHQRLLSTIFHISLFSKSSLGIDLAREVNFTILSLCKQNPLQENVCLFLCLFFPFSESNRPS